MSVSAWTASATASGAHAGGRGSAFRTTATDDCTEESGAAVVGTDDPLPVTRAAVSEASSLVAAACTTRPPPRTCPLMSSAAWSPVPTREGRELGCAGRDFRVERLTGRADAAADGWGGGGGVLDTALRRSRRSFPSTLRDVDRGRENSADFERGNRRCVVPAATGDGDVGGGGRDAKDCGNDEDDGSGSGHTGGSGAAAERFTSASDTGGRSVAVRDPFSTAVERVWAATSSDGTLEADARGGPAPSGPGEAAVDGASAASWARGGDSVGGGADVARSAGTSPSLAFATGGNAPVCGKTAAEPVDGRLRGDCD